MSKYTIGELSEMSGISRTTLRLYDAKGLLRPSERDSDNNYRLYSEQQAIEAVMIREMKLRGFSMSELKALMKNHDLGKVKTDLDQKIKSLQAETEKIREQIYYLTATNNLLSSALEFYDGTTSKEPMEMVVDYMPETTVLFHRRISNISADHLQWERYNELLVLRNKEQLTQNGPVCAIFYDHYFNQFFFEKGDMAMYVPIKETDRTGEHIRKIGEFLRASMIFVGWYTGLLGTYVELVKQIEKNHYKIVGPAHEEYLADFSYGVPNEKCVTRVFFPIEKKQ